MCLVTVLIVTSAITMLPAPARADNDLVIVKCESDCGNMAAFAAGAVAGSVVTVVATGSSGGVAAGGMIAEMAAIGQAAITVAAPLVTIVTAPAVAAAAPVVVPVAATAAAGYVGYRAWQAHQHSQAKSLN